MVEAAVAAVVIALTVVLLAYRALFSTSRPPALGKAQAAAAAAGASGALHSTSASSNGHGGSSGSAASSSASSPALLSMSVLFGSQSGTAEAFARELSAEARMFGFQATVKDLEDYDPDDLSKERYAVFLMATFGEGEPTDNAASFYSWLCAEERSAEDVAGVRFAVFALGNRQYEHFCLVGQRVDERLHALGGARVTELGQGDDDGSLEGDFRAWKAQFWERTAAAFGTAAAADGAAGEVQPHVSAFALTPLPPVQQAQQRALYVGGLRNLVVDPKHRVVVAPVVDNRELRQSAEDDGSTRHIEVDLSAVSLPYLTADNCGVYPRNDHRLVAQLLRRLQLDGAQLVLMKGNGSKRSFLPSPCSVQDIFLHYLDASFTPRLSQLPVFAHYCSDAAEKARLLYWAKAGADEYVAEQYTFLELLHELPSMLPPLADVVDWTPHLSPRFYTISSSSLVQPRQLSLTVSVLTHHKTRGRTQTGVCSGYLAQLRPGKDSVAVFIRPSAFRLPRPRPLLSTGAAAQQSSGAPTPPPLPPVLMIGPGTGLAPFRGFIQEATAHKARAKATAVSAGPSLQPSPPPSLPSPSLPPPPPPSVGYGSLCLFFGCRSSVKDFIYREELLQAVKDGVLSELHLAFSREQSEGADSTASESSVSASSTAAATASLARESLEPAHARPYMNRLTGRVYVQDRMRGAGDGVWEALHRHRGYIFVCGGTAMGRAVREVLAECCKEKGGMSAQQADAYIKRMQEQKRYVQELWS